MKLSIITINFNNLEGLKKTAESVINQTWKDFEWIIIDGGSTDGSKEYIINLNDNLNHNGWDLITYWCSEPDKGIYNAMNKGIAKASGEYLNFMNSGDCFYESGTLERVSVYLEEGVADVYYGNTKYTFKGKENIQVIHSPLDIYDLYVAGLCHQSSFIKRSCLENNGYIETYKIVADYDKWLELAFGNKTFLHIDILVCEFDKTGISETEPFLREKERILATNKYYPEMLKLSMGRLFVREEGHLYKRLDAIINRGGLRSVIVRGILKILD